ncbi:MAG TPA: glycerol-3-phosphate 1-O-acyltransferase PlsY [Candidatus Binatia bacterium]
MNLIYATVLGYLFGSIPFGLLLTRAAGLGDVRQIGSGNIGATNVLRMGSRWIAGLTLFLDMLKGFVPVLVAARVWDGDAAIGAAAGALAGHILPVWLRFKGGKGVATYIGALAGLYWPLAILFVFVWLIVAAGSRMSSLSALAATAVVTATSFAVAPGHLPIALCIIAIVIFIAHRANILRLLRNQEPTIDFSKKA